MFRVIIGEICESIFYFLSIVVYSIIFYSTYDIRCRYGRCILFKKEY